MQSDAKKELLAYKKRAEYRYGNGFFHAENRTADKCESTAPEKVPKSTPDKLCGAANNGGNLFALNFDFSDTFFRQNDTLLILGILFCLWGENNDKLLLFVLLYILM